MMAIKAGVPIVPMVLKRAPRPFIPNAIKIGATISTEQYQNKKLEKSDLNDLSAKIQESMAGLLDGFEHKPKPKRWEKEESKMSRGVVFVDGKLLVIKRVKEEKEYYVLPGGHADEGESARDAVAREVQEETGVKCEPVRLLYKYKHNKPDNPRLEGMQSVYLCEYKSGEPAPTDAEEYTDTSRENGTYEPMLMDIETLKTVDFRYDGIKTQLLRDIERYGTNLTRSTKYVK